MYLGDFKEDSTVNIFFTTNNGSGAAVAPSSAFEAADVLIYKNSSNAQKTTTNGVTMTSPFDTITGLHQLSIDTSNDTGDGGFWVAGADYTVVLSPDETVDTQTVVSVIGQFSIENRCVNWAKVGSPSSTVNLSATTVKTATDVETDTADIQSRLPAALVSGRMDSSVGAMAANVMTAAAAAADLTTELQSGLATASDLATVAGYIDTEVAAIKAKTDNLPAAPAAVSDIPTANQNADALLDRAAGIETGRTLRQTMRLIASVLLGKVSGAGTGTEVFRDIGDTKDRVTATVDSSGNRTAITLDAT